MDFNTKSKQPLIYAVTTFICFMAIKFKAYI